MSEGKIKDAIENAKPAKRSDDPPAEKKTSRKKGKTPHDMDFPKGCPVEPLGIHGDLLYLLDEKRQLRVIKSKDLNHSTISDFFVEQPELLYTYWPTYKEDKEGNWRINGWNSVQARDVLRKEAGKRGLIDILETVRGSGCWIDNDGKLVMHCGNVVYHDGKPITPTQIGRHVYPAEPPRPKPSTDSAGTDQAEQLLSMLKTWNWRRPDLDPALLLGWIGAAILGGALKWRPMIWVTGDKATGKSTLHEVLKGVLGPGGIISSTDTTAAGIWQTVGHRSLPVALDEVEAEADDRKTQAIIKLARQASSAGQSLRGGADHKGSAFTVRQCFLFSSILIPPMLGQDISRMAVLRLDELNGEKPPALEPEMLEQIGAVFRARLISQWSRFSELLFTFQATLADVGHGGRSGDQFGTLMACYHLLISDDPPEPEDLDEWAERLRKETLAESEGDQADHERCISYMLDSQLDLYRSGEKRTISSWIIQAAGRDKNHNSAGDITDANRALGNIGLLVQDKKLCGTVHQVLQIANDHQGLSTVFRDTQWSGRPGSDGAWVQAVRRIKNSWPDRQRFNGIRRSCTAVLIDEILGKKDGGDDA